MKENEDIYPHIWNACILIDQIFLCANSCASDIKSITIFL